VLLSIVKNAGAAKAFRSAAHEAVEAFWATGSTRTLTVMDPLAPLLSGRFLIISRMARMERVSRVKVVWETRRARGIRSI